MKKHCLSTAHFQRASAASVDWHLKPKVWRRWKKKKGRSKRRSGISTHLLPLDLNDKEFTIVAYPTDFHPIEKEEANLERKVPTRERRELFDCHGRLWHLRGSNQRRSGCLSYPTGMRTKNVAIFKGGWRKLLSDAIGLCSPQVNCNICPRGYKHTNLIKFCKTQMKERRMRRTEINVEALFIPSPPFRLLLQKQGLFSAF